MRHSVLGDSGAVGSRFEWLAKVVFTDMMPPMLAASRIL